MTPEKAHNFWQYPCANYHLTHHQHQVTICIIETQLQILKENVRLLSFGSKNQTRTTSSAFRHIQLH